MRTTTNIAPQRRTVMNRFTFLLFVHIPFLHTKARHSGMIERKISGPGRPPAPPFAQVRSSPTLTWCGWRVGAARPIHRRCRVDRRGLQSLVATLPITSVPWVRDGIQAGTGNRPTERPYLTLGMRRCASDYGTRRPTHDASAPCGRGNRATRPPNAITWFPSPVTCDRDRAQLERDTPGSVGRR